MEEFSRTQMLLGQDCIEILKSKRVIVFGVGGVGGYVCESLARSGVGRIDIVDNDTVSVSNINRQIIALHSTVGRYKTEVMRERMLDINPSLEVTAYNIFYTPESSSAIDFSDYDYIVDAIDTVSGKIELVMQAEKAKAPIISSMGAGNKLDPTAFEVSDIYKTSVCPLARAMRTELKKRGVKHLKVVYSREQPLSVTNQSSNGKRIPGSCAFVPSVAGLIISGEVIKDLLKKVNCQ